MVATPRSHRRHRQARALYRMHAATINEVCRLCGQPIDYRLRHPDPMAWTLEHIVPLSEGGPLLDTANYASAHRRCQDKQGGRIARNIANATPSRRW